MTVSKPKIITCKPDNDSFPTLKIKAENRVDAWLEYKRQCEVDHNKKLKPIDVILCTWKTPTGKVQRKKTRGPLTEREKTIKREVESKYVDEYGYKKWDRSEEETLGYKVKSLAGWWIGMFVFAFVISSVGHYEDIDGIGPGTIAFWFATVLVGIVGLFWISSIGDNLEGHKPGTRQQNSSNNSYNAMSFQQKQNMQNQLDELNDRAENMNDRMDGFM